MAFSADYLPYSATRAFSEIAVDFVESTNKLAPLYQHPSTLEGIKAAIAERKTFHTDRKTLVDQLRRQYGEISLASGVTDNIQSLLLENTFTITTAHQPNIFTGHLYFIYKILHTIRVAEYLKKELPENNFVPVYYMGSEDADLEELGEVTINGKKYVWQTDQTGAVGRMKVDKAFISLVEAIEGQLAVEPHGEEVVHLLKKTYTVGKTIEMATFELVHELFADYGLVILLPDNAALKKSFAPVIKKELAEHFSYKAVAETMKEFPPNYKVQAGGREVNLFYLQEGSRERIEKANGKWTVVNTDITFEDGTILSELEHNPERFSPNVILRPVFQELVLPNIIFIGGGGELAYWLELKRVFEAVKVPYPVLVLRNSFMLLSKEQFEKLSGLQMSVPDLFNSPAQLEEQVVKKYSDLRLSLDEERRDLETLYKRIKATATSVDPTLEKHVQSLHVTATKKLGQLEKKMLKAEKTKFEAKLRQVQKIRQSLFPNGSLQERVDNFMPYYALYGKSFIETLYKNSLALEQQFCMLTELDPKQKN